jgi:mannose-6-phosphate isomerase-like protein (cupin superfamily)
MTSISRADMERRLVRYRDLRPCTTAFIDARTPGSERKENFTIIGPGVAENPDQFVHIDIPHGFNIGGARQPPRCVNSQHSHETAEVFVIHTGIWRFKTGETGSDGHVDLGPGDAISIPTHVFRGFENVGDDLGFMFAVLGGDDPGRVTWAPYVFEAAARHGLVLLESGRLIDTTREAVPAGAARMPPTTAADVARFTRVDSLGIAACTVTTTELAAGGGLTSAGVEECPIVGPESPDERMPAGRMGWTHGFHVRALRLASRARIEPHSRAEEEVLLVHAGALTFTCDGGTLELGPGDTLTVPRGLVRSYGNAGAETAVAYVVRGGDRPAAARFAHDRARTG